MTENCKILMLNIKIIKNEKYKYFLWLYITRNRVTCSKRNVRVVDGIYKEKKGTAGREFRDDSCKKEVMQIAKESRINTVMTRRNRENFRIAWLPDDYYEIGACNTPCGYWKSSLNRWEARLCSAKVDCFHTDESKGSSTSGHYCPCPVPRWNLYR